MALIIENGSNVVGANSFVTVAEAIAYAEQRRATFPTDDEQIEALLLDAMDYITSFRKQFSGQKVSITQENVYPRLNSTVDGEAFPNNAVPREVKMAQMQLAVDAFAVGALMPTTNGYAVAREKVGDIEIEYAAGGRLSGTSAPATPSFPKADTWLQPLFDGAGAFLSSVRV